MANGTSTDPRAESGPLARFGLDHYYVFPSYGPEFRDMAGFLSHWDQALRGSHRFWPGFSGGGVLAAPLAIPQRERDKLVLVRPARGHNYLYGMVLGNEAGEELRLSVTCATPVHVPAFAVRFGLAERVPEPSVKVTAEHAGCLGGERILLVVPKANRKSLKLLDQLPRWFDAFGVAIEGPLPEVPAGLREEMGDWFGDPDRPMLAFRMTGGEANAAWQLAIIYYIAEYWDTHARGLDTVHLVADIEGHPNFRRNWTSRR
jgi:hypothetical protein